MVDAPPATDAAADAPTTDAAMTDAAMADAAMTDAAMADAAMADAAMADAAMTDAAMTDAAMTDAAMADAAMADAAVTDAAMTDAAMTDAAVVAQANLNSELGAVTPDGRFVCFNSRATNLVAADTNNVHDVFVRDTCTGATGCTPATIRVSVATDGTQGNAISVRCAISASGRYVAFESNASTLVAGDTNALTDVFVRDTCIGATSCTPTTTRVSLGLVGAQGNGNTQFAKVSSSGRFVLFASYATNLVPSDTNNRQDAFVHDTCAGAGSCAPSTVRVSVASDGSQANNGLNSIPAMSSDGRHVAFSTNASNLVPSDTNGMTDVFVRDTCTGGPGGCIASTVRVSLDGSGAQVAGSSGLSAVGISDDGRHVVFDAGATTLVAGDTNNAVDIFVRDTCTGAVTCTPATVRASVSSAGVQSDGASTNPTISGNGRHVAFESSASTLVPGDNAYVDIFVRDTCTAATGGCTPATTIASLATDSTRSNENSALATASGGGGRYVVFQSDASTLVPGDTNGATDIFVRDTCAGASGCTPATSRVSVP